MRLPMRPSARIKEVAPQKQRVIPQKCGNPARVVPLGLGVKRAACYTVQVRVEYELVAGRGRVLSRSQEKKSSMNQLKKWFAWLFDFSQGEQQNQHYARVLTGILQVALAESETDAGFEQCYRRLVKATDGLSEERAWAWLNWHLRDCRSAGEFTPMPRTLAACFLRDIPRRYDVKAVASSEASVKSAEPPAA